MERMQIQFGFRFNSGEVMDGAERIWAGLTSIAHNCLNERCLQTGLITSVDGARRDIGAASAKHLSQPIRSRKESC